MTIDEAKEILPSVWVLMPNGKRYSGRVTGRRCQFPTVTVPYDGLLHSKGPLPWIDFKTSWQQIADFAETDKSITYT